MSSFAYPPEPGETPDGFVHVGWSCDSPDHFGRCFRGINDGRVRHQDDGEIYLEDSNHHASWSPIFGRPEDWSDESESATISQVDGKDAAKEHLATAIAERDKAVRQMHVARAKLGQISLIVREDKK